MQRMKLIALAFGLMVLPVASRAQQPDTVARCALAALGRRTVAFTEPASALAFRPASDLRLLASGGIAAGLDLYRAMRERRAS